MPRLGIDIAELHSSYNYSNIDATDPRNNPAHMFGGDLIQRSPHRLKRHNFEGKDNKPHHEIFIAAAFPTKYFPRVFEWYSLSLEHVGDKTDKKYDAWFAGTVTANPSSCRPFYVDCDGQTYLEVCNFSTKQVKFERPKLYELARVMVGCKFKEITQDGATFRNDKVDFRKLPNYAFVKYPGMDRLSPSLVGYIFDSDNPDAGVAWYYSSQLVTIKEWMDRFKLQCDTPGKGGGGAWKDSN
ncbi:hypothetical protein DRE_03997 [Drechslerella stenobrocha 248]|uniref:Uncharacterized protein n=1 Tax=Drechslerella stenobrocha 248 TaxID=1043628 RepID=W7I2V8_9PEZI|nr:hypothetical protein DRE_03997 [Drechslerella stenobrocha 248]